MRTIGVGLGVGLGVSPEAEEPGAPNPQLLLWSEAIDNAAWTKTNAAVTANAALDPLGAMTAEHVVFSSGGSIRQITSIAATAGGTNASFATTEERPTLTTSFDGVDYVLSFYVEGDGAEIRARLDVSGGFIRVSLEDIGDEATFDLAFMKLETPSLTAYVKREGT